MASGEKIHIMFPIAPIHLSAHAHLITIQTVFPRASTRSPSMREKPAGGTTAWSAASAVPSDECGEGNLFQLKDDIIKSITLTI